MFIKLKRDLNDALYSDIIRLPAGGSEGRCVRCGKYRKLDCAHIFSRDSYNTRFVLEPKPNAIPLCSIANYPYDSCHKWFDGHKQESLVLNTEKRVFQPFEESFTFLVVMCGYTWEQLEALKIKSDINAPPYNQTKPAITIYLRAYQKKLRKSLNIY